ncbi:hypothetical protein RGQ15_10755 [Paracoccus sp. MBLB3053]|uniref:Peptidase S8/S53 domain-containing protein n=1 Tax=Paracoccus aurantius TaxID=3073814 RepID=A0ABU2HU38_9RHOB|nr:hypothetical protein [Paracoccus sp. MBLB3053]MDS9468045.1 hypothetical protein [Paracoccus sp. MBLB3053]
MNGVDDLALGANFHDEVCKLLPELVSSEEEFPSRHALSDHLLSPQTLPPDPERCAITAVIDHAIPFAHRLLTTTGGFSRVASIWLQETPVTRRRDDIPFGQEFRGAELDRLRGAGTAHVLDEDSLYRELGLLNPAGRNRWLMRAKTHGAAVIGTAAGYRPADPNGLQHPVIAVGLPDRALADTSGAAMPLLLETAIAFIISRARLLAREMSANGKKVRPPVVINISLGITAGPRDGHSRLERLQDMLSRGPVPDLGPVRFVLAAGNTRAQTLLGVLEPGQSIGWRLPPDDRTPSEVQIWSAALKAGSPAISLEVTLPDGRMVASDFVPPKHKGTQIARICDPDGGELARLVLQAVPRGSKLRQCLSIIAPPTVAEKSGVALAPAGTWRLRLRGVTPGPCDMVVQRDDRLIGFPRAGRQSYLVEKGYSPRKKNGQWKGPDPTPAKTLIRRNGTCNAYAWGSEQLRCGAVYLQRHRLPGYASLLQDGTGGDVLAPSDRGPALPGMLAPGTRGASMQALSGTSISAPRLTRWISRRFAAGERFADRAALIAAAKAAHPSESGTPKVEPDLPWPHFDD